MEIKQFKLLSIPQKKELYNFIKNKDLNYSETYTEMVKMYESDIFTYGDNIFILFDNGQIKGSIAVITKEIRFKGEVYATDIYIEKEDSETTFRLLIKKMVEYCHICYVKTMKIGIRANETYLIPYINKLKFDHIYDAVVMKYRKDKNIILKINDVELSPLRISNSNEYINIHNDAFRDSPNGASIDEIEVKDYIVQYANNEDLIGICSLSKKECGIYELSIHENIGWVDTLGIIPAYQNKGLGKKLLENCIKKLFDKNLDEIRLLVITSNENAFTMYKKTGFEEDKVFSYWFEKNIY